MTDKIDKAAEYTNKLLTTAEQVISTYSQPVTEAALGLIRLEAIYNLAVLCFVLLILAWAARTSYKVIQSGDDYFADDAFPSLLLFVSSSIVGPSVAFIFLMASGYNTLLCIYNPKLYLLQKLMDKVI